MSLPYPVLRHRVQLDVGLTKVSAEGTAERQLSLTGCYESVYIVNTNLQEEEMK
jgi:hypothetical protein